MSEYWVSHKKYFCKYCNIYIADDAPSRSQHEGGLRHKGNVERFVRGLYKTGEKRRQDLDEEKREMAWVEQAAQAAFARDVGAGLAKPGSSSTPAPTKTPVHSKPTHSSNPYDNYSTAESLGFTDPDAERLKVEAERRRTEGLAGEWEVVAVVDSTPVEEAASVIPEGEGSKKREAETQIDEEDGRQFKLHKKKLGAGLGEIYDPGLIPIKLKTEKEEPSQEVGADVSLTSSSASGHSSATTVPKWSSRGWNKPTENGGKDSIIGDEQPNIEDASNSAEVQKPNLEQAPRDVKAEEVESKHEPDVIVSVHPDNVKIEGIVKSEASEPTVASGGGLFRKRKLPAGAARSRGRHI